VPDRDSPTAHASLPPPGPSFVREHDVRVREHRFRAGMSRPTDAPDDWWLTVFWVAGDAGLASFRDLGPAGGPPPDPPLARLGPSLAGALGGLVREEDGRIAIRLTPVVPPADATKPWDGPVAIRAAFKWEPMRQAVLRPNELADTVLGAFRRSVEGLSRPQA
jgi:hypothetical protein